MSKDKTYANMSGEEKDELQIAMRERLEPLLRPAWKPQTLDEQGPPAASRFGGAPWLAEGEDWPICPNCEEPLTHFLQLDIRDLPEPLQARYGTGLIQLFYCTNDEEMCEVECEAYFPFSEAVLARRVDPAVPGRAGVLPVREKHRDFAPKRITGWQQIADELPGSDECRDWLEQQGIGISRPELEALWDLEPNEMGDKVGGWPHWVQNVEYPECPQCQRQMQMLIQIDSDDHLPQMFGDMGCGHLTQCPEHKDVVAFGWACA